MDYMDAMTPCPTCGAERWAGEPHQCPEIHFPTLRQANLARQTLWGGDQQDGSYRGNELAGETGEALECALHAIMLAAGVGRLSNLVKKLERERLGLPGSRTTAEALGAELGDVQICLDLLAAKFGIDLQAATAAKFNDTSRKMGFPIRYTP